MTLTRLIACAVLCLLAARATGQVTYGPPAPVYVNVNDPDAFVGLVLSLHAISAKPKATGRRLICICEPRGRRN